MATRSLRAATIAALLCAAGCAPTIVVVAPRPLDAERFPPVALSPCRPPPGFPAFVGPGRPILRARLDFPNEARAAHLDGCASIAFRIGPDGSVSEPQIVAERPLGFGFGPAALRAVSGSRYEANRDAAKLFLAIDYFHVRS